MINHWMAQTPCQEEDDEWQVPACVKEQVVEGDIAVDLASPGTIIQ